MTLHRLLMTGFFSLCWVTGAMAAINPYHILGATDPVSMEACLNCHESSMLKSGIVHFGNYCLLNRTPYPPAGKEKDFNEVAALDQAGSVLEQGRVTCLSCHDLTKPRPYVLRDGYKLCSICHLNLKNIR